MLVQAQGAARPQPPGILDSPTLARVERAMLRHGDGGGGAGGHQELLRAGYTQSLLSSTCGSRQSSASGGGGVAEQQAPAIKRGLLWQQRDRLFSRWKERYFVLTRDYLHCFRRASGAARISEMGQFLFKVKLVDVDRVEWENKKTYSTVALVLGRDGKIYLRAADGLEDWFELLEECTLTSKERRRALRFSHDGKPRDNNNITASLDEWLAARQKLPMGRLPADNLSTTRQEIVRRREWVPRDEDWEHPTLDNRLSLLTDIDISGFDGDGESTLGAPSVTSYRLSRDVLCVQPPQLRPVGSFRSARGGGGGGTGAHAHLSSPAKRAARRADDAAAQVPSPPQQQQQCQYIRFRERSYSDIQHVDRRPWRALALSPRQ